MVIKLYFILAVIGSENLQQKMRTSIREATSEKTVKAAFEAILFNNSKSYKAYLNKLMTILK